MHQGATAAHRTIALCFRPESALGQRDKEDQPFFCLASWVLKLPMMLETHVCSFDSCHELVDLDVSSATSPSPKMCCPRMIDQTCLRILPDLKWLSIGKSRSGGEMMGNTGSH